jgi:hypothetical protein
LHLEVGSFPLVRTVSLLVIIGGPKATLGSAVACGILLSVFEGVGVLLNRTMGEANRPVAPICTFLVFSPDKPDTENSRATARAARHTCLISVSLCWTLALVYTITSTLAYTSLHH